MTPAKAFCQKTNEKSVRKNILTCMVNVHNVTSLSGCEQACLMRPCFKRYFSQHRAT